MAKVHICDVKVLNNPCPFFSPFQYEIVFECIDEIPEGMLLLLEERGVLSVNKYLKFLF